MKKKLKKIEDEIIKNIRKGFATNSSSSHFILPDNTDDGDDGDEHSNEYENVIFGRNKFVLTSEYDKKGYCTALIKDQLHEILLKYNMTALHEFKKRKNIMKCLNVILSYSVDYYLENESVDYIRGRVYSYAKECEENLSLPVLNIGGELDLSFMDDFIGYLLSDKITIYGGGDEDNHNTKYYSRSGTEWLSSFKMHDGIFFKNGNEYVVYSKDREIRYRYSFDKINKTKLDFPLLMDIKITDYCESNCSFCYQNSSKKGKHSILKNIENFCQSLPKDKIFEFAIGGGDALSHPDIVDILFKLKRETTICNLTINEVDEKRLDIITRSDNILSALGISCHSFDDFLNKFNLVKDNRYVPKFISFHVIPEYIGMKEVKKIINHIKESVRNRMYNDNNIQFSVLFLSAKEVGRGNKGKNLSESELTSVLKSRDYHCDIGIDTPFAKKYDSILKKCNIDKKYYDIVEGESSIYLDMVQMKAFQSSYENKEGFDIEGKCLDEMFNSVKNYV